MKYGNIQRVGSSLPLNSTTKKNNTCFGVHIRIENLEKNRIPHQDSL